MPGQHDLGRGRAAPIRDGGEGRISERRGAVGYAPTGSLRDGGVCGNQFRVVQRRIEPNLIPASLSAPYGTHLLTVLLPDRC